MVKDIKDTINVRVRNNTALPQNVNILGGTSDPLAVPPSLLYQWDLSTEVYFGSVTASIVISTTANPTPVIYTVQVNGYNIESVVSALNTLNFGVFQYSGDIVYVSNDFYIYGVLQVGSFLFVSTWDTNNTSFLSSASNQIQLPLVNGGTYNFIVDWGDGFQDTITSWNQAETLHTYATAGVYTLSMSGTISEWSFGNAVVEDNDKILSISSWGSLQFGTISNNAFANCNNLDLSSVSDIPDLSSSNSLALCFSSSGITTINRIDEWDVSNITNTQGMFSGTSFNQNISSWDVSSVTSMVNMFNNSSFNQNINTWDVSSVTDMGNMFGLSAFNQNIGSWNVSSVINMGQMFQATPFNQDISSWNVSNVTTMSSMFSGTTAFNQDISSWDVSSVTSMASMFNGANVFNQPLNSWNVSNVTNMALMFGVAIAFNQNLNSWIVSNVTSMSSMFLNATSFNGNITSWNVSSVTNMVSMFSGATAFNQPLNSWNVSNVTNMQNMFILASSFNQNLNNDNTLPQIAYFNQPDVPNPINTVMVKIIMQKDRSLNNTPIVYYYKLGIRTR
jgi:surface protein